MPLDLFRIDERLLHGQVLVGWGERLGIAYYVIADDPLVDSRWEQELYASGAPEGTDVRFLAVTEATRRFDDLDEREGRGALLTRDTGSMRLLAEAGCLEGRRVNVGGIHVAAGRRKALDYVFLGEEEAEDLIAIEAHGATVSARDLPTSKKVPLKELLRAAGHA